MNISGISYVNKSKRKLPARPMAKLLSALLIFVIAVVLAVSSFFSWKLTHPIRILPQLPNKSVFTTLKDVSFMDSKNQVSLKGWYFSAPDSDRAIIMVHDYGENRMIFGNKTTSLIKSALEQNFNVLTFDQRGCGLSDYNKSTLGFYEKYDLLGAIDFVKSKGIKHIALIGVSMGAATSILAVSENPGAIDALVCDSPFSNLKEFLYDNLPSRTKLPTFPFSITIIPIASFIAGIDAGDVNPILALEKIPAEKIMLIHSEDDTITSYDYSLKLYRATDSSSVFWVIRSAAHGKIFEKYTEEYIERILTFFDKRMSQNQ